MSEKGDEGSDGRVVAVPSGWTLIFTFTASTALSVRMCGRGRGGLVGTVAWRASQYGGGLGFWDGVVLKSHDYTLAHLSSHTPCLAFPTQRFVPNPVRTVRRTAMYTAS